MNPGLPIVDNIIDFGIMLLAGILVSAFFDLFRAFRKAVFNNGGKNKGISVQLQDFIFALCTFLFVLLLIYRINDGIVRSYIVAGFSAGVVLYAFVIVKISGKIFYGIFYGIIYVLFGIGRLFKKLFQKTFNLTQKGKKIS